MHVYLVRHKPTNTYSIGKELLGPFEKAVLYKHLPTAKGALTKLAKRSCFPIFGDIPIKQEDLEIIKMDLIQDHSFTI